MFYVLTQSSSHCSHQKELCPVLVLYQGHIKHITMSWKKSTQDDDFIHALHLDVYTLHSTSGIHMFPCFLLFLFCTNRWFYCHDWFIYIFYWRQTRSATLVFFSSSIRGVPHKMVGAVCLYHSCHAHTGYCNAAAPHTHWSRPAIINPRRALAVLFLQDMSQCQIPSSNKVVKSLGGSCD